MFNGANEIMVQNNDTTVSSGSIESPSERSIGPKGKSILVTGGAGFIGSHLVDALVEHNEVRILDDFSSGFRSNVHSDVTVIEGDMRNETLLNEAMRGIDLVFHQAALVSVTQSVETPKRSHETNVSATVTLLDRARREDARVVLASSAAIYGTPERIPISEDHPKKPMSPYGLDKLTADQYAQLYHEQYGLETVMLRYFNAYGPRQVANAYSGVVSIFLDQARNGEPITVEGDGTQIRDFVHVSDIVQANLLAASADVAGEAYNVGTGRSVSVLELAEAVQQVAQTESEIVHTDPRPSDISRSRADISKIEAELGYEAASELASGLGTLLESNDDSNATTVTPDGLKGK